MVKLQLLSRRAVFGMVVLSVIGLFCMSLPLAMALDSVVGIQWTSPSSGPQIAGYKVYMGTEAGMYGLPVDVGKVTTHFIPELQIGQTYFFAVTAYDAMGNESIPSNEISRKILTGSYLLTAGVYGGGQITSHDNKIACQSQPCRYIYSLDAEVTLTAHAHQGFAFYRWINWTGDSPACRAGTSCTLFMNQAHGVTAIFLPEYFLTVYVVGNGAVSSAYLH